LREVKIVDVVSRLIALFPGKRREQMLSTNIGIVGYDVAAEGKLLDYSGETCFSQCNNI
jgi:hypothetical protein